MCRFSSAVKGAPCRSVDVDPPPVYTDEREQAFSRSDFINEERNQEEESNAEILHYHAFELGGGRMAKSNSNDSQGFEQALSVKSNDKESLDPFIGNKCSERLYSYSKQQQEDGKLKKRAIDLLILKRRERRMPPRLDFGKISLSRASDMYNKGKWWLQRKEAYLHQRRTEEDAKYGNPPNLSRRAFARSDCEGFQARVEMARGGARSPFKPW